MEKGAARNDEAVGIKDADFAIRNESADHIVIGLEFETEGMLSGYLPLMPGGDMEKGAPILVERLGGFAEKSR